MAIQNVSLAVPAGYPTDPNVALTFQPKKVTFMLDDATAGRTVSISLNGVTDHIKLSVDSKMLQYVCEQRHTSFWVKGTGAAALVAIAES